MQVHALLYSPHVAPDGVHVAPNLHLQAQLDGDERIQRGQC